MREKIVNLNDENLFVKLGVYIILSITYKGHLPVHQGSSTYV
jgi:hypothetical protein